MNRSVLRRKRKKMNIFIPTATLADIAFLLLIFFMLTSKFLRESHITFKQPTSPDIRELEAGAISVIIDKDGKLWLQGKLCGSSDELRQAVERLITDKKDKIVMLKVDKEIKESVFGPVLLNLSKTGVKIALLGTKSKSYAATAK